MYYRHVEARPRHLQLYVTRSGRAPFDYWLNKLSDRMARAKIRIRLERLEDGNLGHTAPVGQGVMELKINYGPGYRVYFGQEGTVTVLLLCGGDKSTQDQDIRIAQDYWKDYQQRREKHHG